MIRSLNCYKDPDDNIIILCFLKDVEPADTGDLYGETVDELGIWTTESDELEYAQEDCEEQFGVDSEEALKAETMKVITAKDPSLPEEIRSKVELLAEKLDRVLYCTFDNPLTQIFINVRDSKSIKLKNIEPLAQKILVSN